MPTYRGNRGNLLQHWVLAETIALIREALPATAKLCFVDAHAMSPYAIRSDEPSQTSNDFDAVADHLPGSLSRYEQAWKKLRHGRCEYPSSASIVRHQWTGPLHLVLCEKDPVTAKEIAEWQRTIPDTRLNLHQGDWRQRFQLELPKTADAYLISFDPYMFDRHAEADTQRRGNMWRSDIVLIAGAVSKLAGRPVVVQLSSYSANNDNAQDDVIRSIQPVFDSVGLALAATVRAGGNMMSLVFVNDKAGIQVSGLQEGFSRWFAQATASTRERGDRIATVVGPSGAIDEFSNGNTRTTQIGYENRNRQRCEGHRGVEGTDHGQRAYRMRCLDCGHVYGANGTDIFQRKCPACGGGAPGIPF